MSMTVERTTKLATRSRNLTALSTAVISSRNGSRFPRRAGKAPHSIREARAASCAPRTPENRAVPVRSMPAYRPAPSRLRRVGAVRGHGDQSFGRPRPQLAVHVVPGLLDQRCLAGQRVGVVPLLVGALRPVMYESAEPVTRLLVQVRVQDQRVPSLVHDIGRVRGGLHPRAVIVDPEPRDLAGRVEVSGSPGRYSPRLLPVRRTPLEAPRPDMRRLTSGPLMGQTRARERGGVVPSPSRPGWRGHAVFTGAAGRR